MKKLFYVITAVFVVGLLFTACKENKKAEDKVESHETHEHDTDELASKQAYHCMTDCEKGKTYDKEGVCPVCKSKLALKAADDAGDALAKCTCKQGGDCTCVGGCKCSVADAEPIITASCSCKSGGDCACVGGCECTA